MLLTHTYPVILPFQGGTYNNRAQTTATTTISRILYNTCERFKSTADSNTGGDSERSKRKRCHVHYPEGIRVPFCFSAILFLCLHFISFLCVGESFLD
jgi:hypothetical protein